MQLAEAQAFLEERLQEPALDLEPIGYGEWSHAFCFKTAGAELVARFGRHVEDFRKDQLAQRFSCTSLPVPRLLEIAQVRDQLWFALSERAHGTMIDDLDEQGWHEIAPRVLDILQVFRDADMSFTSGFGIWNPDGEAPYATWHEHLIDAASDEPSDRTHGWRERLLVAGAQKPFDDTLDRMLKLVPYCPEHRHLLHTDLLHYNVLVDSGEISAVVDWGNAKVGDFLYELALFTFYQPYYPRMAALDWRTLARERFKGEQHFEERLRCYELHIALVGMAYCAFKERWKDFHWNAARACELQ